MFIEAEVSGIYPDLDQGLYGLNNIGAVLILANSVSRIGFFVTL